MKQLLLGILFGVVAEAAFWLGLGVWWRLVLRRDEPRDRWLRRWWME